MQITMDISEQFCADKTQSEIISTLKLYAALARFQAGKLSAGAATELAKIEQRESLEMLAKEKR